MPATSSAALSGDSTGTRRAPGAAASVASSSSLVMGTTQGRYVGRDAIVSRDGMASPGAGAGV